MNLPKYSHLEINVGIGKIPFGTFPILSGALLGFANAQGVDLGYITLIMISGPALIGAARAASGTLQGDNKYTIVNYVDLDEKVPELPERKLRIDKEGDLEKGLKFHDYHSTKSSGKRALKMGLIYQVQAIVGFGINYIIGKISL